MTVGVPHQATENSRWNLEAEGELASITGVEAGLRAEWRGLCPPRSEMLSCQARRPGDPESLRKLSAHGGGAVSGDNQDLRAGLAAS